jgi:hypothetical protein
MRARGKGKSQKGVGGKTTSQTIPRPQFGIM